MGKLGRKFSQQGSSSSDEASWPLGGLSRGGHVEASLVPSLLWQHRGTWKGAARWQVGEGEV